MWPRRNRLSLHLAENTRQRVRNNVKVSGNVFNGEVVILKTDCPAGGHVGRVLHGTVREGLVVRATRKMPTPKLRAPMGKSPDDSETLFYLRAVVALTTGKKSVLL